MSQLLCKPEEKSLVIVIHPLNVLDGDTITDIVCYQDETLHPYGQNFRKAVSTTFFEIYLFRSRLSS